jgi:NAD(P)H-nitrite reductase large subunit
VVPASDARAKASDPVTERDDDHDGEHHAGRNDVRVCYCMKVDDATIRAAIRSGARDLEALKDATRAGTGCGTCRSELLAILREENDAAGVAPRHGGAT